MKINIQHLEQRRGKDVRFRKAANDMGWKVLKLKGKREKVKVESRKGEREKEKVQSQKSTFSIPK